MRVTLNQVTIVLEDNDIYNLKVSRISDSEISSLSDDDLNQIIHAFVGLDYKNMTPSDILKVFLTLFHLYLAKKIYFFQITQPFQDQTHLYNSPFFLNVDTMHNIHFVYFVFYNIVYAHRNFCPVTMNKGKSRA